MVIKALGAWYTGVEGNEKRGDMCGYCGEGILEGQKFYSWSIGSDLDLGLGPPPKSTLSIWVQLHRNCMVQVVEKESGITDSQFELYRLQVISRL